MFGRSYKENTVKESFRLVVDKGYTLTAVSECLGVPRSTISRWLKSDILTSQQQSAMKLSLMRNQCSKSKSDIKEQVDQLSASTLVGAPSFSDSLKHATENISKGKKRHV